LALVGHTVEEEPGSPWYFAPIESTHAAVRFQANGGGRLRRLTGKVESIVRYSQILLDILAFPHDNSKPSAQAGQIVELFSILRLLSDKNRIPQTCSKLHSLIRINATLRNKHLCGLNDLQGNDDMESRTQSPFFARKTAAAADRIPILGSYT